MKTTVLIAAAIAAGSTAAFAQEPPSPPPGATQNAPTATSAATARPPAASEERLNEVRFMADLLASAVRQGAQDFAYRIRQADPNSLVQVNPPHARGIALDGYGVVFDVDVPLMNLSIVTTLRESVANDLRNRITDVQQALARTTNPDDRASLGILLRMLTAEMQTMPPPPAPDPRANTVLDAGVSSTLAAPVAGTVTATSTDNIVPPLPPRTGGRAPDELYSDAVKRALIDAMLNHSAALRLADDEWLTVAARDNGGPSVPGALDERSGVIIRIKGSDLAAFQRNQLTHDDVLKRIEIREWR